ncbi:MBL fold metallo-hydrolase [Prescottella defluvii]|nr:MBL fold metallo-hydrolase [Prescottella defluvii]
MTSLARGLLPSPLPDSIPIPEVQPPAGMDIVAVPTGVTKRVAAFGYRGGSLFDRRDFNIGSVLVRHPRGDLLVDAGFGRDIDLQFATMPRWFRQMTNYELWMPARDQLEAAGYDFGRLSGILLTHAHWDHVSGLPDFPDVPVLAPVREQAALRREGMHGYFGPPFRDTTFLWRALEFDGGPISGFLGAWTSTTTARWCACRPPATRQAASLCS